MADFHQVINTCLLHILVDVHVMGPRTSSGAGDTNGNSDRVVAGREEDKPRPDMHRVTFQ